MSDNRQETEACSCVTDVTGKKRKEKKGRSGLFRFTVNVTLLAVGLSRTRRRAAAGGFYGALASC